MPSYPSLLLELSSLYDNGFIYAVNGMLQSVDIINYTDEEYDKYLNDPVCTHAYVSITQPENCVKHCYV